MAPLHHIRLDTRTIVSLTGADAHDLLQGLVTCDVARLAPDHAIFGALLTPQGKYLHDFFLFESGGAIHLDCEAVRRDDLIRRLTMYRLRADVTIAAADEGHVFALIGDGATEALGLGGPGGARALDGGGVVFADPRDCGLGARAWLGDDGPARLAALGSAAADIAEYDRLRIARGVPDGSRDWRAEDTFALEAGLERFNGVDFDKGCYVGQEVTARMKHRDLVRKLILPVRLGGAAPESGTAILNGDVAVGEIRTSAGEMALAVLRRDQLDTGAHLTAGGISVTPVS